MQDGVSVALSQHGVMSHHLFIGYFLRCTGAAAPRTLYSWYMPILNIEPLQISTIRLTCHSNFVDYSYCVGYRLWMAPN